jgi:xylan 1,4-beta-xylosidase
MAEMGKSKDDQWKDVERGTLTQMARKAKAEAGDLPLYYTEWNSLAGLPSDGPFGASFIAKTIVDNVGLVEGYSYWTFSDIFEEGGMPSAEFHGGYGLMTLHGIPKASYRAFELLHKLGSEIYDDQFSEGNLDVYTIDKPQAGAIQILAVNHNSFSQDNFAEQVSITIEGLSSFVKATVERIDNENGNAIASWQALGSPEYISEAERYTMLAASRTRVLPFDAEYKNGSCKISLDIPEQGIALVTIYQ